MLYKTAIVAVTAYFANTALATPVADPDVTAASIVKARADDSQFGFLYAYPNVNYAGSPVLIEFGRNNTPMCTVYGDINNNKKRYPAIRSFIDGDLSCFAWTSTDCSGNVAYAIANGVNANVNYNVGSFFCNFTPRT